MKKDFVFILIFASAVAGFVCGLVHKLENKDMWYVQACGEMVPIAGPDNIDEANHCWNPGVETTWLIDKDRYECMMAADRTKVYRVKGKLGRETTTMYRPCKK